MNEQIAIELFPANICLFKVNRKNTRKRCEIVLKVNKKTPELRQWRRSGVLIVSVEHISHLCLVFLLLTLNKRMLAGFKRLDYKDLEHISLIIILRNIKAQVD